MLYITGRKKDIIIKGGVNINPKILEDKIKTLDFIIDVAVVGIKDKIFGEKAVAVIVTQNDNEIDFMSKLKLFSKDNFFGWFGNVSGFVIFLFSLWLIFKAISLIKLREHARITLGFLGIFILVYGILGFVNSMGSFLSLNDPNIGHYLFNFVLQLWIIFLGGMSIFCLLVNRKIKEIFS